MKIQDKKVIARAQAVERQQEIDTGLKLAKKVDELRVTKAKEEADLGKWREKTIELTQAEIDAKIAERDALKSQLQALEQERLRLEAPVDLTEEWKKVNKDKIEIEGWKRDLFEREANLISRELLAREFPDRDRQLKEKEAKTEKYLEETNESYKQVERIRASIESRSKELTASIEAKRKEFSEREMAVAERESVVEREKERFANRERQLIDRDTGLILRESAIKAKEDDLYQRDEEVKESENLTNRYRIEAKQNYDESEAVRGEAAKLKVDAEKDIEKKYATLAGKQTELAVKERDLNTERESIEREKRTIADEKLHIASQQETLKIAWEQIKKIKH